MSNKFVIRDTNRNNERKAKSRSEAKETKNDLVSLGADPSQIEIISLEETNGDTETVDAKVVEHTGNTAEPPAADGEQLPDDPPIDADPVDWLPNHFVDDIQGVPTVNRKGYAVIASKYGISVTAEAVTLPSETEFKHAEFCATARTPDGKEYSGFGSAHVDRQDGDDTYLLAELAETRAMKRAVAWASGVGMTAVAEMQGTL
jgi:hypothetical protein